MYMHIDDSSNVCKDKVRVIKLLSKNTFIFFKFLHEIFKSMTISDEDYLFIDFVIRLSVVDDLIAILSVSQHNLCLTAILGWMLFFVIQEPLD